jgi:hypothetical protein
MPAIATNRFCYIIEAYESNTPGVRRSSAATMACLASSMVNALRACCAEPQKVVPQLPLSDVVCIENRPFKYLHAIYEVSFLVFAQFHFYFIHKVTCTILLVLLIDPIMPVSLAIRSYTKCFSLRMLLSVCCFFFIHAARSAIQWAICCIFF